METNKKSLVTLFHSLKPWQRKDDFKEEDWRRYIMVAKIVQLADFNTVEAALNEFILQAVKSDENYQGFESESKAFLLMRVLFDIPEVFSSTKSFSYKGWTNWPAPDENGNINLAWPVTWKNGHPELENGYKGSMGQAYAAALEYRFLKDNFKFRKLK